MISLGFSFLFLISKLFPDFNKLCLQLSIAVIKHCHQKQLGKHRLCLHFELSGYALSLRVVDRNTGQQRWNERTAYSSRFALLSATVQAHCPRGGTTHTELGPPTSIKKTSPQACLHNNLKNTLSQLRFFFPNNFSLCQVDKNK